MATKVKENPVSKDSAFWQGFTFVTLDRKNYADPVQKRRKFFSATAKKQISSLEGNEVKCRKTYREVNGGIQVWFTYKNTTIKLDDGTGAREACFVFSDKESAIGAFKAAITAVEAGQLDAELERVSNKHKK